MAHLHYSDFTDSHWYSGSPTDGAGIWIRDPVIDGVTTLDDAMELLDQARKEVQAIQNAVGTNPQGAVASLALRLDPRVSPEGHPRGLVRPLRGANSSSGTLANVDRWWDWGANYAQFGVSGTFISTNTASVTFNASYFTGIPPRIVIPKFVTTTDRIGAAQLDASSITETGFDAKVRAFNGSGSWTTPDFTFRIAWIAYGGFPA